jgi:hypothetical protein
MRDALRALNALVEIGTIEMYAIGGAIGAAFYIDALQTEDVDAFVFLPESASGLVSLAPIYSALERLGGVVEREFIRFGNWPLQILPDSTPLVSEAIREARSTEFESVPTRVFRPEHLCCIALQTGRGKDMLRVSMFLEQKAVDIAKLRNMADRFGLSGRLAKVESMFDGES